MIYLQLANKALERNEAKIIPNSASKLGIKTEIVDYVAFLITSKVLDVRRRGATTEAYEVIRRKEQRSKATQQNLSLRKQG